MNYFVLISGIFAIAASLGHFIVGYNSYLKPVIEVDIDLIAKNVMISLFHYMSVFMVISAVILTGFGFGSSMGFENWRDVCLLIGTIYLGFGIAQFLIAINSSVQGGMIKMFQWIFWFLIALFSLLEIYL